MRRVPALLAVLALPAAVLAQAAPAALVLEVQGATRPEIGRAHV